MFSLNQKQLVILAAVLVFAVGIFFIMFWSSSDAKVELTIALDKPSYKSGEEINLTLRLSNSGDSKTCVSSMSTGNVRFLSLTKDGQPVEARFTPAYFIAPLSAILEASLVSLDPGESLDILLSSEGDDGLGKQALKTMALDDGRGLATFYDVETPGNYKLEVAYEYPGLESSQCPDIYKDRTNTAVITFTVTP